jgi:hypothetical protein
MGLLFKVQGVDQSSPSYLGLSITMLTLCIGFAVWWVAEMSYGVVTTLRQRRLARAKTRSDSMAPPRRASDGGIASFGGASGGSGGNAAGSLAMSADEVKSSVEDPFGLLPSLSNGAVDATLPAPRFMENPLFVIRRGSHGKGGGGGGSAVAASAGAVAHRVWQPRPPSSGGDDGGGDGGGGTGTLPPGAATAGHAVSFLDRNMRIRLTQLKARRAVSDANS